jgi:hypothetical protein
MSGTSNSKSSVIWQRRVQLFYFLAKAVNEWEEEESSSSTNTRLGKKVKKMVKIRFSFAQQTTAAT